MADFNQLVQEVITVTNRPDLVAATQQAVKAATLQAHRSDFYFKDLVEQTLVYETADYLQSIPYKTLFPRYRALSYLRKYNPNANPDVVDIYGAGGGFPYENGMGPEFTIISPDQIFDSYALQKYDVAYVAGDQIKVRSSTKDLYAVIGIYQNPDVSSAENYKSWIADEFQFAIIYLAAANLFGAILNNPNKKASTSELASIEINELKASNITAKGY